MTAVSLLLAALSSAQAPPARAGEAAALPLPGTREEREFRFLVLSDPHFYVKGKKLDHFREFLARVKPLGADFAVILGDICGDDYPALALAREIADASGFKVYFVPGNHDDAYGNKPEEYRRVFGTMVYSFDHKGRHFIGYWSQRPPVDWLREDLAKVPKSTPVVFWQHYPPTHHPKVWAMLQERPGTLALTGHVHAGRSGVVGNVRDVNVNTFDAGFLTVDALKDGRYSIAWRPRGIERRLVLVHPGAGAGVAPGPSTVVVNAFDTFREVRRVEVDAGGGWAPMTRQSPYTWTARAELPGGTVSVRAVDAEGETWTAKAAYRAAPAPPVAPGADWPIWGGTPDNRRFADSRLAPPLALAWHVPTGRRFSHAPPVVAGGLVLAAGRTQDFEESNLLLALDAATGREVWRRSLPASPNSSPAATEGVVAVTVPYGKTLGFDLKSGTPLWTAEGVAGTYGTYDGDRSSFTTAWDGFFVSGEGHVLSAKDGTTVWKQPLFQYSNGYPAVAGGRIFSSGVGFQYCRDARTGAELFRRSGTVRETVQIVDGVILADGLTGIRLSDGTPGFGAPPGRLALGLRKGRLSAVDPESGNTVWQWEPSVKGVVPGRPACSRTHAFFAASDDTLRAVELSTGREVWSHRFGARLNDPVLSGNAVFVTAEDGGVAAFSGPLQ
jgi:3',5'-cyclic AMP phosphodiesterase CpdA